MRITEELIEQAEHYLLDADCNALEWLRRVPRTVEDLVAYRPDWATWALTRRFGGAEAAEAVISAWEAPEWLRLLAQSVRDVRTGRLRLRGADLHKANFYKADLQWADFSKANLQGANLLDADLRWTNFSEANLQRACFACADLIGADFYEADLTGAFLTRANFTRADLTRTNLTGTDVRNTSFRAATGLTAEQVAYLRIGGAVGL